MAQTRNLRNGKLIIRDGTTPTALDLEIPIQDGDLSFTINQPSFVIKNRGKIDHRREGDEMEMPVSFSFKFEQWSYASGASTGISVADALQQLGGASTWKTTDTSGCAYSVDLIFRVEVPCDAVGGKDYEQLVFPKFHAESLVFSEGAEANTVQVSGNCLAKVPTRTFVTVP